MKRFFTIWGPAILMMGLIFLASATPGNDLPHFGALDFFVKKGGHMIGYALLACAYLRALSNARPITRWLLIAAVILSAGYASTDEFHQMFTQRRSPSFRDILIDTTGALIGVAIWSRIHGIRAFFAPTPNA